MVFRQWRENVSASLRLARRSAPSNDFGSILPILASPWPFGSAPGHRLRVLSRRSTSCTPSMGARLGRFHGQSAGRLRARRYRRSRQRSGLCRHRPGSFLCLCRSERSEARSPGPVLRSLPQAPVTDVMLDAGGISCGLRSMATASTPRSLRTACATLVSSAPPILSPARPLPVPWSASLGAHVIGSGRKLPRRRARHHRNRIANSNPVRRARLQYSIGCLLRRRQRTCLCPSGIRRRAGIFVARDGSPMLLDADTGVMLDAMSPAHSRTHIQILATGLGAVTPNWPTGIPAPLTILRRSQPPFTRISTASKSKSPEPCWRRYVGFYLMEIAVPKIVQLRAGGALSGRGRPNQQSCPRLY